MDWNVAVVDAPKVILQQFPPKRGGWNGLGSTGCTLSSIRNANSIRLDHAMPTLNFLKVCLSGPGLQPYLGKLCHLSASCTPALTPHSAASSGSEAAGLSVVCCHQLVSHLLSALKCSLGCVSCALCFSRFCLILLVFSVSLCVVCLVSPSSRSSWLPCVCVCGGCVCVCVCVCLPPAAHCCLALILADKKMAEEMLERSSSRPILEREPLERLLIVICARSKLIDC